MSYASMDPRPVAYSAINDQTHLLFPGDLNSNNTAFGGRVLEIADRLAATVAAIHSGRACVTLLLDSVEFLGPAIQGEVLIFKAAINRVWQTSMEVGVKVLAKNPRSGDERHVVSAYFTFVGINEVRKPIAVPPVLPETEDEKRRFAAADARRQYRLTKREGGKQ